AVCGGNRRAAHRGEGMTAALVEIRAAPGLDTYLDALEVRLERAVGAYPGVAAAVGKESLAAGGKRLRPVRVFLSAPDGSAQRHDAETTVDAYLERCALKTAKLFEAACVLGGGESLREFGSNLGIVFQIVDDILDCTGQTIETGKVAGTDLRDGTPTLPLILGAQEDPFVRRALAGGPQDGALV